MKNRLTMTPEEYTIVQRVSIMAHEAVGQKRKYTGQPYWTHPKAVARTLLDFGCSFFIAAAGLLHDVLEDTEATPTSLVAIMADFEGDINLLINIIQQLSNKYTSETYPNLNRAERHILELARLAQELTLEGAVVKLADLMDNTADIVKHDPEFAKVYLPEKERVLDVCKQVIKREGYMDGQLQSAGEQLLVKVHDQLMDGLSQINDE